MEKVEKRMYKIREAAKLLGISYSSLYKWIKAGKVKATRVNPPAHKIANWRLNKKLIDKAIEKSDLSVLFK